MNGLLLIIFFTFSIHAFSYNEDLELSQKLTEKYKKLITLTPTGENFYKRFNKIRKNKFPNIYFRYSDFQGLGWYELGEDSIYFNTKYLMIFFGIKGYSDKKIVKIINSSNRVLNEWAFYTDTLYLHELIHCLQDSIYGKSRYMQENGLFLEFEYEAYFISDMYFHEKMKRNKKLFLKILSGEYSDIYVNNDMGGYILISTDLNNYKKNIEKRYRKEIYGYVSLTEEEQKRKEKLEEKKLISYATGKKEIYKREKEDYQELEKQKKEYLAFLDDFYKIHWTKFSIEALTFIQESAMEAKNYPLALDTIGYLENKSTDDKLINELRTKSALIILSAIDYIKDHKKDMDYEIMAQHIKSLENACLKTKRAFPQSLNELRKKVYMKTIKKYLKILDREKDEYTREYYKENIDFFIDSLVKNYGLKMELENEAKKSTP